MLVCVSVLFALSAASTAGIALAEDKAMHWPSVAALAEGFGAGWLVLVVWGSLGAVLGVTLRGVALPIGLGVVWVLGIENLVSAMASNVLTASAAVARRAARSERGFTGQRGDARPRDRPAARCRPHRSPSPVPLVTLVCYLAACAALAIWTTRQRDVV